MGNGTLGNFETQIIGTTVNKMSSDGAINTKGKSILKLIMGKLLWIQPNPEDIIILIAVLQIAE